MECKEAYDPSSPANFGIIQHQQVVSPEDLVLNEGFEREKQMIQGSDEEEFNEDKENNDLLIEQLNAIETKIEDKLAELDHTEKVLMSRPLMLIGHGGQIAKFTALLAPENYHGVVGFAKAKVPTAKIAIQRIYLWPGPMRSGMSAAGRTVETVLYLAGFSNVKSKVHFF
ncbi:hypothetical protein ABZP36_008358 [Zizania latifolia]